MRRECASRSLNTTAFFQQFVLTNLKSCCWPPEPAPRILSRLFMARSCGGCRYLAPFIPWWESCPSTATPSSPTWETRKAHWELSSDCDCALVIGYTRCQLHGL